MIGHKPSFLGSDTTGSEQETTFSDNGILQLLAVRRMLYREMYAYPNRVLIHIIFLLENCTKYNYSNTFIVTELGKHAWWVIILRKPDP